MILHCALMHHVTPCADCIAQATAAERERAARIAETLAWFSEQMFSQDGADLSIAAAIRAGDSA
jgi:hypothetical protein